MRYTDQQLRGFARKVIEGDVENPDFIGVAEQFGEEWEELSFEELDQVHRAVHDLACSATVSVTFPGEQTEVQRLTERLRGLPTVYMDGVEAVPLVDLRRVLDERSQSTGEVDGR